MSSEPAASMVPDGGSGAGAAFDLDPAGRYQRLGFIGQGGMGRVFRVRDLRLGREVALKELLDETPGLEARLAGEVQLTAQLDHPGIVPIYDAGRTTEGRCFYTMRLVRGRSLGAVLREGPALSARLRLVDHVLDAARALAFAHERGVLHRDVKPENVLLGPRGETQLADWGLACRVDDARERSAVAGTARFLAPERVAGGPATKPSDVYALGITLLDVLGAAIPLSTTPPDGIPPALWSIVARALAPDVSARYADAGQLADELAAWRAGGLVASHRYSLREWLGHAVRVWRTPLIIGGLALAITLVVAGSAWRRTAEERERALLAERHADQRTAALLVQRAATLLEAASRGEASVLAAHASRLAPSPEATGLRLALAATVAPVLGAHQPLEGCRLSLPLEAETLCATETALRWLGVDGRVRRELPLAVRRLVASDDETSLVALTSDDEVWRVPVADGPPVRLGVAPRFASGLGLDTRLGLAWAFNPGLFHVFGAGETRAMVPCGPRVELFGVLVHEGVLAMLCSDGVLPRLEPGEWLAWVSGAQPPHFAYEVVAGDLPAREAAVRAAEPAVLPRLPPGRWRPGGLKAITTVVQEAPSRWLLGNVSGVVSRLELPAGDVTALAARAGIGPVRQVLPLAEGRLLVVGERGAPQVLDASSGALVTALPHWAWGRGRAQGAELVLTGRQRSTWRLDRLAPSQLEWPVGLASVSIDRAGRTAVVSGAEGLVSRWSLLDGRVTPMPLGLRQVVKSVALSPSGDALSLGAVELLGIHVERGGQVQRLPTDGAIQRVGWLAGGQGWALGYSGGLHFFEGETVRALAADHHWIDASGVADGSGVVLLDAQGSVVMATPQGVTEVASRPFAQLVVASGLAGPFITARGATLSSGAASWSLTEGVVTALALSPEGRWLAVGDSTGALSIYEGPAWQLRARASRHEDRVSALAFSAEGTLVSAGWDRRTALWNLAALADPPDPVLVERGWGVTLDALLREE